MIIDKAHRLEAVLSGAADPAPVVTVDYVAWKDNVQTAPASYSVALNGTTDVVILAAPTRADVNEVLRVSVYNADNASITPTIKLDIAAGGGTEFPLFTGVVGTLKTLCWERGAVGPGGTWNVTTA